MSLNKLSPVLRKRIDKYFSNVDSKLKDAAYLGADSKLVGELRGELEKEKESYEVIYSGNLMKQIFSDPTVIEQFYIFINDKIKDPGKNTSYKGITATNLYGKEDKAFVIKNITYSHAKSYMTDFINEKIIDPDTKKNLLTRLKDFQIGHIIGLQSLRALNTFNIPTSLEDFNIAINPTSIATKKILRVKDPGKTEDMSALLSRLAQLLLDLDISTTNSLEHNLGFYAHSVKSLNSNNIDALLELQLTESSTELANRSSGNLARELASIVNVERKIKNEGTDQVVYSRISLNINKKGVAKLTTILEKEKKNIEAALEKISSPKLKAAAIENFNELANLESSDTLKELINKNIVSIVRTGKGHKASFDTGVFKLPNTNKIKPKNPLSPILKNAAKELKASAQKMKSKEIRLRASSGRYISLTSIMNLINGKLALQIQKNMGKGSARSILNYRTGRFAESARITSMTQRGGKIDAFYTYMKNPYQTFEPGFKQGLPTSRDPRKLIEKSIRQLATDAVAARLKAIPV